MADYQSFDGHGVDVAQNRADDLDKKALAYIAEHKGCAVLDLGSGAGGQSVRMAQAGAIVTAIDQYDFSNVFADHRENYGLADEQIQFTVGDMRDITKLVGLAHFDVVVFQRTLHYVSYSDAVALLQKLRSITKHKLYISVTGTGSLIGDTYPCADDAIEKRFCELTDLGKEMFSIEESVCLYDQSELETLLHETGWTVAECWVSAFGNARAVCSV